MPERSCLPKRCQLLDEDGAHPRGGRMASRLDLASGFTGELLDD